MKEQVGVLVEHAGCHGWCHRRDVVGVRRCTTTDDTAQLPGGAIRWHCVFALHSGADPDGSCPRAHNTKLRRGLWLPSRTCRSVKGSISYEPAASMYRQYSHHSAGDTVHIVSHLCGKIMSNITVHDLRPILLFDERCKPVAGTYNRHPSKLLTSYLHQQEDTSWL